MRGVIGIVLPLLAATVGILTTALPRMGAAFGFAISLAAILNTLAQLAPARSLKLTDASLGTPLRRSAMDCSSSCSCLLQYAADRPLRQQRYAWQFAASALLLSFTAFSLDPVENVTTLFSVSAVWSVVWGAWLLREPKLRQRLPATMVMVVGTRLVAV